jgi:hypothetical protein
MRELIAVLMVVLDLELPANSRSCYQVATWC